MLQDQQIYLKKSNISESHALEKIRVTWDSQEQSTPIKRPRCIWIKDESKPIYSKAESNKSHMCSTPKSTTSCTSILTTPENATKMKHDSDRLATLQLRLDGYVERVSQTIDWSLKYIKNLDVESAVRELENLQSYQETIKPALHQSIAKIRQDFKSINKK